MRKTGLNQHINRVHNRSLLLKTIKRQPGITRSELAEASLLSKAAITKIVNPFIESGIIKEDKAKSQRNIGLDFTTGNYFMVAVYLGRLAIDVAIMDLDGTTVARTERSQGVNFYGNENLPDDAFDLIESIIRESKVERTRILAIGIAAPGAISSNHGVIYKSSRTNATVMAEAPFNWEKIHLVEYLEKKCAIPVFIGNNSSLSALAEWWFGGGEGSRNFVQYSVGLGIGAGAIIDNELYQGNDNINCEVGHVTVVFEGEKCFCGNSGCLETIAGFHVIPKEYFNVSEYYDYHHLLESISGVFRRADEGEKRALDILTAHAFRLGVGAVTLANIFNPERIVISTNDIPGISIERLLPDIKKYVWTHAYPVISETIDIDTSKLGDDIHLLGSYAIVLENLYALIEKQRGKAVMS